MTCLTRGILVAALLALSALPIRADSILVGTNLTTSTGGSGMCFNASDCQVLAQQFTLLSPVVIDQVKVAIGAPYLYFGPPGGSAGGDFSVSLANQLGTGIGIGSNTLIVPAPGPVVTEVFDFIGLNIFLAPGTYNLELSAGNVLWPFAVPLSTSTGTVGSTFMCDPTIRNCAVSSNWQTVPGTHAFEIDGTPVAEPLTLLLFGTGAFGLYGGARRKFCKSS